MNRLLYIAFALLFCALAGCAAPISKSGPVPLPAGVARDLVATGWNLDQAVSVGAILPTDPAVACVHGVLAEAGLDTPACVPPIPPATTPICPAPAPSFVPENKGAVSAGSIAYIHAQQLKGLASVTVPMECDAIVGQFVRLGLTKSAPASLLSNIIPAPIVAPAK
jgi:hypothetical protein